MITSELDADQVAKRMLLLIQRLLRNLAVLLSVQQTFHMDCFESISDRDIAINALTAASPSFCVVSANMSLSSTTSSARMMSCSLCFTAAQLQAALNDDVGASIEMERSHVGLKCSLPSRRDDGRPW
jgi:hypothetical protein